MGHLFAKRADRVETTAHEKRSEWEVVPLDARRTFSLPLGGAAVACLCAPPGARERWVLLSAAPQLVSLNGEPLRAGIRALLDRDEIHVLGSEPVYFSSAEAPCVVPCPRREEPLLCARCQSAIDSGSAVVVCPGCGLIHHETHALHCWTDVARCGECGQTTALDGALPWTPEDF